MFSIEFSHNGKVFNKFNDALKSAVVSGYEEIIRKKLAPYEDEIDQSGGKIKIEMTGQSYDANVLFVDIPTELAQKLKRALSEQ